jgi:hypothetical protein
MEATLVLVAEPHHLELSLSLQNYCAMKGFLCADIFLPLLVRDQDVREGSTQQQGASFNTIERQQFLARWFCVLMHSCNNNIKLSKWWRLNAIRQWCNSPIKNPETSLTCEMQYAICDLGLIFSLTSLFLRSMRTYVSCRSRHLTPSTLAFAVAVLQVSSVNGRLSWGTAANGCYLYRLWRWNHVVTSWVPSGFDYVISYVHCIRWNARTKTTVAPDCFPPS